MRRERPQVYWRVQAEERRQRPLAYDLERRKARQVGMTVADPIAFVTFIDARLREDERIAKGCACHAWVLDGASIVPEGRAGWDDVVDWVYDEDGTSREHIARHDPARVLRDVEAKWQVLRLYTNAASAVMHASGFQPRRTAIQDETCVEILGEALKALALAWSDHPDWREEWRP